MPADRSRWRPALATAVVAILALVFFSNFARNSRASIVEPDEGYWIFSSYYYHLAFDVRDLASADWRSGEAFDHPPLAKFAIGWALSRKGLQQKTIDFLRWRRQNTFYHATRPDGQDLDLLNRVIPPEPLVEGRRACCFFFFLASVLLFVLAWRVCSPAVAAAATLYFAFHPLTKAVSTFVLGDGLLLVFVLIAILLQVAWIESRSTPAKLVAASAIGAASALAFDTKINGLVCLIAALASMALAGKAGGNIRTRLRDAGAALVAFAIVCVAFNPSLYRDPAGAFWTYFTVRDEWSNAQTRIFFNTSLPTLPLRLAYALRTFIEADPFRPFIRVPLGLPLLALGLFAVPSHLAGKKPAMRVLIVHMAVWTCATLASLRLAWVRYLLVLLPFASILLGIGVEYLTKLLSATRREALRPAVFCAGFCVVAYWIQAAVTIQDYFERRPLAFEELRNERVALEKYYSTLRVNEPTVLK